MARKPPKLTVKYTRLARVTLAEIWNWNAENYDLNHADAYVAFLEDEADKLESKYDRGKPVVSRPEYRTFAIKRSTQGHGHLVVFMVTENAVEVLAFLHTRQDWQGMIERREF